MTYNCYCCDECNTAFAIQALDDRGEPTCPNCGSETTDTNEVIVNAHVIGRSVALNKGYIYR